MYIYSKFCRTHALNIGIFFILFYRKSRNSLKTEKLRPLLEKNINNFEVKE